MKRTVVVLVALCSVMCMAGSVADNAVIVSVVPSQYGDAVIRWVDLSPYTVDGTWFMEYHVQACYDPEKMEWDTLSVVSGSKAFFFVHRYAWAEGLHYRVVAVRKAMSEVTHGR